MKSWKIIFLGVAAMLLFSACTAGDVPQTSGSSSITESQTNPPTPPQSGGQTPEENDPVPNPPAEPELTADEKLAKEIREQIAARMTENTSAYKVLYCGASDNPTLADGEKAIWVQPLSWKPYGSDTDPDKAAIKPIYFYYPMHDDPSQYTNAQLKSMGAIRVFAYLGIPNEATATNPNKGIVCVHGGSGHAYADYVLEAMRHGYAAIAFDTEGCYAESGKSAADSFKDSLGHKGKDQFSTVKKSLEEQWMYYTISDIAFANTVLRSLKEVDDERVGLTGISWGGLATTIASCYDARFAFSVPIYLSYYLKDSDNSAQFNKISNFGALVWQDEEVLASNRVPTLLINSHSDKFADVNSTMRTYHTLKTNNERAYVLIKPGLSHSQQAGASVAEIYRFGDWVCSGYTANEKAFYRTDKEITKELGYRFSFELTVPKGLESLNVSLYYTTMPIQYTSDFSLLTTVSKVTQAVTLLRTEANGDKVYRVDVTVPDNAYLYYLSYGALSAYDASIPITYTYTNYVNNFYGKIYGSTEIVLLGDGAIHKK